MQRFVRAVDTLSVACAVIASLMLTAAVLIVTWMVIYRAMGNSAYWEIECSIYLMVAAVFLGSPYCAQTNGHVAVDLLTEFTPKTAARGIAVVLALVSLVICVYLAVEGGKLTFHAWRIGETTETLWRPPRWPLYLTMPVGLGLTALQYLAEFFRLRTAE